MKQSRRIVLEDLAVLRWAMEPAAHPSDPLVAYVVSGLDTTIDGIRYDLLLTDLDGVVRQQWKHARAPRWSPQGDRIAFTRIEAGRGVPACWTLDGDEWPLDAPPGHLVDLRWSHDGQRLLANTTHTVVPATHVRPYRAEQSSDFDVLTTHGLWILEPGVDAIPAGVALGNRPIGEWSPTGDRIAVVSDHGVDRDTSRALGLWLWDRTTGTSECLIPPAAPIDAVAWAPDGSAIAYLTGARDNAYSAINELWIIRIDSGERRQLGVDLDRSLGKAIRGDDERAIGAPILSWSDDSSSVAAIYANGGRSRLAVFSVDGSYRDLIVDESCVLEFSRGGDGVAFSWSDPLTPGEVSWFDTDTGESHQVTHLAEEVLAGVQMRPTTAVSAVASDGVVVEGWLTLPAGPGSFPLALQVHGGPHYGIGERFSFDAQRLAALGVAVLRANPRGSQGYGQEFADGNLGDWGGRDFDDLMELVDEVTSSPSIDGQRVAVIGESYGGYMAAWAAGTADRFAAVVVESAIADFLSAAGGTVGTTFWNAEFGGAPWKNPDLYFERSAITRLDRVRAPVLVMHCEQDMTCSIAQGEAIFLALRELGREVEFLRVPEEGHFFNVFGALSRRLDRTAAMDEFLLQHLSVDTRQVELQTKEHTS